MEILKVGLIFGIIGHVINMCCDRVLSITPNGKLTLSTMNDINDHQKMAELYEGVDPSVPMNSAILGASALFLHYFGYISIAHFISTYSSILGTILTLILAIFMHIGGLPLWALIFTILPIFIVLVPFKIIGSLHISAIITFLGWMFLI